MKDDGIDLTQANEKLKKLQDGIKEIIVEALNTNSGNKIAAAAMLKMTVDELNEQMKRFGL